MFLFWWWVQNLLIMRMRTGLYWMMSKDKLTEIFIEMFFETFAVMVALWKIMKKEKLEDTYSTGASNFFENNPDQTKVYLDHNL